MNKQTAILQIISAPKNDAGPVSANITLDQTRSRSRMIRRYAFEITVCTLTGVLWAIALYLAI